MQQYKGTVINDLGAMVTRTMDEERAAILAPHRVSCGFRFGLACNCSAEQMERGNELAKLKKVSGQFWNTPGAAASLGFPFIEGLEAQFESIPEHRAILIRAYQQRDATGPAIMIGYSHAERCYIYKEATQ